jgi:hypothetical protein
MNQYNCGFVFGTNGSLNYLVQALPSNAQSISPFYGVGNVPPGQFNPYNIGLQDASDNIYGKGINGSTLMVKVTNRRRMVNIEFAIIGTSRAQARLGHQLPDPGCLIQLFNWESPQMNGYWSYFGGGSITFGQVKVGLMTLPLIQFEDMAARNIVKIETDWGGKKLNVVTG